MKVIYDRTKKQLVCYTEKPSDSFWDNYWSDTDISATYNSMSKFNSVTRITKKYLRPQDGPILEGGCGVGQFVYLLSEAGYKCIGIDTAERTIKRARKSNPSLRLEVMDVRDLRFPDNYLAGYWSMGVIEHFSDGYNDILNEMHRVLKPRGYLFVTVPVMSLLRRLKAYLGFYEAIPTGREDNFSKSGFYQFIMPHEKIINDFRKKGLTLVKMRNKGGIRGLREETKIFKSPLQYLTQISQRNIIFKVIVKFLDLIFSPIAGHMGLFVFKKET